MLDTELTETSLNSFLVPSTPIAYGHQPKQRILNLTQDQIQSKIGRLKFVEKSIAKVVTYAAPNQTPSTQRSNNLQNDEILKSVFKEETNNYESTTKIRPKLQIQKSHLKQTNKSDNFIENHEIKKSTKNSTSAITSAKTNRSSVINQTDPNMFKCLTTKDCVNKE